MLYLRPVPSGIVLLIAPEGIEIEIFEGDLLKIDDLLIAPEGIEIRKDRNTRDKCKTLNRTRRN